MSAQAGIFRRMTKPDSATSGDKPVRFHYIAEWAESRGYKQADVVRALGVDKGLVSKWFRGAVPEPKNLLRLADLFELDEPGALFRHPESEWLWQFFRHHRPDEVHRARVMLEAAFPRRAIKA